MFLPCAAVWVIILIVAVVALAVGAGVVGMGRSETFAVNVFVVVLKLIVNCTFVILTLPGKKQAAVQPVLYATLVVMTSEAFLNCISYFTKQAPDLT